MPPTTPAENNSAAAAPHNGRHEEPPKSLFPKLLRDGEGGSNDLGSGGAPSDLGTPSNLGTVDGGGEPPLRGKELEYYDSVAELGCFVFVERAGLRMNLERGARQVWRVGEHELVVSIWLDRNVNYTLWIHEGWPEKPAPKALKLAEVYAISTTGELRKLRKPEMGHFKRRALLEAGLVDPPPPLPPLPDGATDTAVKTWEEAIGVVHAERRLKEPAGTPMALATGRLAKWSGLDEGTVRSGKDWLRRHGFIEKVGEVESGYPRPTYLWKIKEAA